MPQVLEQQRQSPLPKLEPLQWEPLTGDRTGRKLRPLLWSGMLIAAAAAGFLGWKFIGRSPAPAYQPVVVRRGDLAKTISATGKLQAVTTVQVGSQISGRISEIYVDYNSQVKKGDIIARLDPEQVSAQLAQTEASLASARAGLEAARSAAGATSAAVESAQANADRMKVTVADAQLTLQRTQELIEAGAAPRNQIDTARTAAGQAAAQYQQSLAQVNQARAQAQASLSQVADAQARVAQQQASVKLSGVNAEYTIIRAPIDGTVIARNVEAGQSVSASLSAPVLFVIAQDLTRMQVLADIDEADVGQLTPDSRVSFTVDAFPSENFEGKIQQIRIAPQQTENVVTYTAVVNVGNPDRKLRPGMTANLIAVVAQRDNVLQAPNAALRFRPANAQSGGNRPQNATAQAGGGNASSRARKPRTGVGVIWKVEGKELKPVRVQLGLSDGVSTEIAGGALSEGDRIATAALPGTAAPAAAQSGPLSFGGSRGMGGRGGRR